MNDLGSTLIATALAIVASLWVVFAWLAFRTLLVRRDYLFQLLAQERQRAELLANAAGVPNFSGPVDNESFYDQVKSSGGTPTVSRGEQSFPAPALATPATRGQREHLFLPATPSESGLGNRSPLLEHFQGISRSGGGGLSGVKWNTATLTPARRDAGQQQQQQSADALAILAGASPQLRQGGALQAMTDTSMPGGLLPASPSGRFGGGPSARARSQLEVCEEHTPRVQHGASSINSESGIRSTSGNEHAAAAITGSSAVTHQREAPSWQMQILRDRHMHFYGACVFAAIAFAAYLFWMTLLQKDLDPQGATMDCVALVPVATCYSAMIRLLHLLNQFALAKRPRVVRLLPSAFIALVWIALIAVTIASVATKSAEMAAKGPANLSAVFAATIAIWSAATGLFVLPSSCKQMRVALAVVVLAMLFKIATELSPVQKRLADTGGYRAFQLLWGLAGLVPLFGAFITVHW